MMVKHLFSNIRFSILLFSVLLSLSIAFYYSFTGGVGNLNIEKVTKIYALVSVGYLYLALLTTPLLRVFPTMPYAGTYLKARRAIGVSVCYFALLHSSLAFFFQLGGFQGLFFLSNTYILAISFSAIALLILCTMAATSFDRIVTKMTYPKWKLLHRFVYLAAVLILIHALILGDYFSNFHSLLTQGIFLAIAFLLFLEAIRMDKYIQNKWNYLSSFGPVFALTASLIIAGVIVLLLPENLSSISSLNIHAAHIQLAQDAAQNQFTSSSFSGLVGDKTLRYTVSLLQPEVILANQDVTLRFKVYNAGNGSQVGLFKTVYEKPMHLIVVNNELTYFSHIHPQQEDYDFVITTNFPKDDMYRLYLDFQPFGAIEQQIAFSLPVGNAQQGNFANQTPDGQLTKQFGQYIVSLNTHGGLRASDMSIGKQTLTFTLKDATTHRLIKTLYPYLAAFGHLVMIDENTYDYLHVHPANLTIAKPTDRSGPSVDFLPIGIYGPFKPGVYRLFAQFNPDGNLFTADFTVKVNE